jgi:DNA repair ATPase RecN
VAKAYVEVAAAQLTQALNDIKNQIDQVARDGMTERQQVEQTLQSLENEKRLRQGQLLNASSNNEPADAQMVRNDIADTMREIDQKKADLQRIDQDIAARQQDMQRAASEVQTALHQVNRALGCSGLM